MCGNIYARQEQDDIIQSGHHTLPKEVANENMIRKIFVWNISDQQSLKFPLAIKDFLINNVPSIFKH